MATLIHALPTQSLQQGKQGAATFVAADANGFNSKWAPHESYKASGVEWLGDVPEHWDIWKLRHAFRCIGSGTTPPSESLDYYNGEVPWVNTSELRENIIADTAKKVTEKATTDFSTLTLYPPGSLLVAMYGATIGRLGILGVPATVNQACCAFAEPIALDTKFTFYWLLMRRPELIALSAGGGQPNLNQDKLCAIRIPAPPLEEQREIVKFLDRETKKIDALVSKKERLIALLAEKRTVLISHVVTKGLDPNASMKDSGEKWLGQIPAHWKMKRLKYISALQTGLTLGKDYGVRRLVSHPYLRVANVQDGYLDLETITEIQLPPEDVERYELRRGDVLMTEGGDFDKLGRGYVWENQIQGCLHQNHIFAVRSYQDKLKPHFLAAMLTSSHGKHYFTSTSQQTTNLASTNSTKLRNFALPIPPIDEQCAILVRIRQDSERLDSLIATVRSGIDRLREYRTALISAAVTGKIDVRRELHNGFDNLATVDHS